MYNLSKYISKARCYAGFCYFMHSCLSAYDWLKANNISHDTYYYWYAEVKKAYVNDSLPEIVSVDNELVSSSASISSTTSNFSNVSSTRTRISSYALPSIRLSINDVSIEVNELTNPELLANVIKAVRYA